MAVLSHSHLDHTGGAHEFDAVAVHALEADAIATPPAASLHPRTEMDLSGSRSPTPTTSPAPCSRPLPEPGYDESAFAIRPATVTRALSEGDVIDLGDRRLRVIHAPGHTRGSILLYDEDLRWLYTGDVLNDSPVFDEMQHASRRGRRPAVGHPAVRGSRSLHGAVLRTLFRSPGTGLSTVRSGAAVGGRV